MVTLTGPGGVGKTRLTLSVAADVERHFRDGVYFVALATVTSADVMWKVLADTLGINVEGATEDAVSEHLAARSALLVLDNLEQLDDAAGVIAQLLAVAPHLMTIATSRRPMHLQGECEFPVPGRAGSRPSGRRSRGATTCCPPLSRG